MKRLAIPGVAALALLGAVQPAAAVIQNPATAQFNVTITIAKQCTVIGPATIDFGTVGAADLVGASPTAAQNFTVLCSRGTPYTIGFSSGNDAPTGGTTHVMKGTGANTDSVSYNLLDATSGATNTSPLSASSSVISGTGTGLTQTRTLQAKIISYTAPVMPDTYTDTVTLSVAY